MHDNLNDWSVGQDAVKEVQNIKRQIRRMCRKGIFDYKKIVLFGCTVGAKILRDELKRLNYPLDAIIDNNESKAGLECMGVTICTPESCLGKFQDDVVVLIWSKYWREMTKQLENMGYKRNVHLFVFIGASWKIYDDSLKEFFLHTIRALKGYKTYNRIRGGSRDKWVFICPYPGTGDVYMAGRYFHGYIKRENINDYTVLVMNQACAKTASLYRMKNIRIINGRERDNLLCAYDFLGPEKMHMKPLLYWGWRTKQKFLPRYCKHVTFNDMFQYDVYGMGLNCKVNSPIFSKDRQFVKDFFDVHRLKEGKTVIMAPYAGSFDSDIPKSFWIKLAKELKKRGYCVCTNSVGNSELIIEGTEQIFFDLTQTELILDEAGYFIALRSGLCDIVSSSKCRKIIFYENGFNALQYDFFSLKKMGLSDDAIEIIYQCESDNEFLNIVLNYFEK